MSTGVCGSSAAWLSYSTQRGKMRIEVAAPAEDGDGGLEMVDRAEAAALRRRCRGRSRARTSFAFCGTKPRLGWLTPAPRARGNG